MGVPRVSTGVEEHLDHALACGGRLELNGQVEGGRTVQAILEVNVSACRSHQNRVS